jgi:phage terminase small subunit
MAKENLSPKQRCFVEEYLVDLNATQAAIRAGYSAKTAKQQASRLLTNVNVAAAVDKAKRERSEATEIDAEWVLQQAVKLYERVTQEVRPVLNPKTRKQVYDDDGNAVFSFNAAAANRALEIIGKHVEVAAFKDRIEVTNGRNLAERIQAGRDRAYQIRNQSGDGLPEPS